MLKDYKLLIEINEDEYQKIKQGALINKTSLSEYNTTELINELIKRSICTTKVNIIQEKASLSGNDVEMKEYDWVSITTKGCLRYNVSSDITFTVTQQKWKEHKDDFEEVVTQWKED